MYESFYGLTDRPFKLSPDPSYYFGSKQHSRARAYLEYGMHQGEGFIVVTGEVGAGKTTIVRSVLDSLDASKILAANLVSTQVDAEDTLRLIGAAFGLKVKDIPKSELLMTIEAGLLQAATQGRRCLLIVDEAQSLTPRAVEELRMLSNFQIGNRALLQSFLVGQPEFREILQSPNMQQLRQRVIASCHIGPLLDEEVQAYIAHRMKCAGWQDKPLFDAGCSAAIYRATSGIPRRINMICDRMLLKGFIGNSKEFDARQVEEIARELAEETMGVKARPVSEPDLAHAADASPVAPQIAAAAAATVVAATPVAPKPASAPTSGRVLSLDPLPNADQGLADDSENIEPLHDAEDTLDGTDASDEAVLIATLVATQLGERITDLERSLLRLERSNSAMLALLQKKLGVAAAPPTPATPAAARKPRSSKQ
jgi:putative secretion ATPase (PEP-CTERM system associated)